jgi:hypothetical protein
MTGVGCNIIFLIVLTSQCHMWIYGPRCLVAQESWACSLKARASHSNLMETKALGKPPPPQIIAVFLSVNDGRILMK